MGRRSELEQGIRRGQTIIAERERAESEAERLQVRKRKKRRKRRAVVVLALLITIGYLAGYTVLYQWSREHVVVEPALEYQIKAEIVDEKGTSQISTRVKDYIALLEQDLTDIGIHVIKFILPNGTSRELFVDVEGVNYYFKVSMERDAAVTAEDMGRMMKYLSERNLNPEYVDVRVQGKAYYK